MNPMSAIPARRHRMPDSRAEISSIQNCAKVRCTGDGGDRRRATMVMVGSVM